jgi:hypothetical protein
MQRSAGNEATRRDDDLIPDIDLTLRDIEIVELGVSAQ